MKIYCLILRKLRTRITARKASRKNVDSNPMILRSEIHDSEFEIRMSPKTKSKSVYVTSEVGCTPG